MSKQHEELRALAMAATPGPWVMKYSGGAKRGQAFWITEFYVSAPNTKDDTAICADVIDPVSQDPSKENAAFIAKANPATILALLDELADHKRAYALLFKENAKLRKDAERYRWLRSADNDLKTLMHPFRGIGWQMLVGSRLDAAIDAAKGESNAD